MSRCAYVDMWMWNVRCHSVRLLVRDRPIGDGLSSPATPSRSRTSGRIERARSSVFRLRASGKVPIGGCGYARDVQLEIVRVEATTPTLEEPHQGTWFSIHCARQRGPFAGGVRANAAPL